MKKRVIFAFALLISISALFAQTTVTGKVFDKVDNKALSGATVVVEKFANTQVTTDQNGIYTITVPVNGKVLVAKAPGYKPIKIGIGQKKTIDIGLVRGPKKQGPKGKQAKKKSNPSNSKGGA